ncbi:MAG: hypothetical protein ACR2F1_08900 [Nitrososphaeraceae archaeon]
MSVESLFLLYIPVLSTIIVTGLFVIALINLSTLKKNLKIQSEHQIYTRIFEARLQLEMTETFSNIAKDSPVFAKRFSLVNEPKEYYTIIAFLDIIEFLFRLYKTDMIDNELWYRWKNFAQIIMTIPKFKAVWNQTKDVHTKEFIQFIDDELH